MYWTNSRGKARKSAIWVACQFASHKTLIFRFAVSLSCVVIVNLLFYFMLPCYRKAGFARLGVVFLYLLSSDFPEHIALLSPGGDKPRHYFSWRASHPAESSL